MNMSRKLKNIILAALLAAALAFVTVFFEGIAEGLSDLRATVAGGAVGINQYLAK